jgi:DNA-directed RNA polymerase
MLSRLVGRRAPMIWHARLPIRWMNHSLGRRAVIPSPTPYILLDTHSTTTVTNRVSRVQSTVAAKVPTSSLSNTTSKQQKIFMLNRDLIFVGLRASHVDHQLAVMYARLKIGHMKRALRLYNSLTDHYPDQKERLTNVNIYNAFIDACVKRDGKLTHLALHWLDKMEKQQIKPNLTTYVILIKGFLRSGNVNAAHSLLMEMLKEGHDIYAFMLNRNISNHDLEMLNLLHRAREGGYFEISLAQINKLLSSAGRPTIESTKTPTDLSSVLETRPTDILNVDLLKALLIPVEANNTKLYERQLHFEEQAVSASLERLRVVAGMQDTETPSNSYSLRSLMWSWYQKLYPMIVEEQQNARSPVRRTDALTGSLFLLLLNAEKLSMLTIQQLLRLSIDRDMANDINAMHATSEIGNAIEMEYYTEQLCKCKNDLIKARHFNLQALYSSRQLFDIHTREIQTKLLEEEEKEGDWLVRWPKHIRIKLGSLLISMLLRVAKIKTTYYDKETGRYV